MHKSDTLDDLPATLRIDYFMQCIRNIVTYALIFLARLHDAVTRSRPML